MLNPCKEAKEVLEKLFDRNINVVVVSNSKTFKIEYLFSKIGYSPTNEESPARNKQHVRGSSMKFVIDNGYNELPEFLEVNKYYRVPLRRKSYHKVLLEEMPDYVIEDVFSLDTALPLYLRLNRLEFKNLKVIQKIQKHTPEWVKDFLSRDELKGIVFMIDSIDELPEIMSNSK